MSAEEFRHGARQARQRRTLQILATLLILGGLLLLFALTRVPFPLRVTAGLGDLFAGLVLLVVVRQKFPPPSPPGL
jgi:hypothetical protein